VRIFPVSVQAAARQISDGISVFDAIHIGEGDQIEVVSFFEGIEFVIFEEVFDDTFDG
jgi:hypothetical protein